MLEYPGIEGAESMTGMEQCPGAAGIPGFVDERRGHTQQGEQVGAGHADQQDRQSQPCIAEFGDGRRHLDLPYSPGLSTDLHCLAWIRDTKRDHLGKSPARVRAVVAEPGYEVGVGAANIR